MEDIMLMLGKYMAILAVGSVGVWGAAEALGKPLKYHVPKPFIAAVLGIAFAVIANGMHLLPVPEGVTIGWSHAFAAIMGLFMALGAKQFNDRTPLGKKGK